MKVILEHDEIVKSIKTFVAEQGVDAGSISAVTLTAGRGDNGFSATVHIGEESDNTEEIPTTGVSAPKKRKRRTKAQIEADEAAAKADLEPEADEDDGFGEPTDVDEDQQDDGMNDEADMTEEPVGDVTDEEPTQDAATSEKSLFSDPDED